MLRTSRSSLPFRLICGINGDRRVICRNRIVFVSGLAAPSQPRGLHEGHDTSFRFWLDRNSGPRCLNPSHARVGSGPASAVFARLGPFLANFVRHSHSSSPSFAITGSATLGDISASFKIDLVWIGIRPVSSWLQPGSDCARAGLRPSFCLDGSCPSCGSPLPGFWLGW